MTALADFAEYLAKYTNPNIPIPFYKTGAISNGGNGRWVDSWLLNSLPGAAITTAAAPTNATVGALPFVNPGAEQLFVLGVDGSAAAAPSDRPGTGMLWLCDRLSHQGGLSGTVTTVDVTTNLPTAALTRYTDGAGVMLGISIYTVIGTTATTISCKYTNEAGTGGRVSPLRTIGATNEREASRFLPIPLAAGDTGVRSVESSTLTATTGTAGAFGYTLYKPLVAFAYDALGGPVDINLLSGGMSNIGEVLDDACLFWLHRGVYPSEQRFPAMLRLASR